MRSLKGNSDRDRLPNLLKNTNNIETSIQYHTNEGEEDFIFADSEEQMFDDHFRDLRNPE